MNIDEISKLWDKWVEEVLIVGNKYRIPAKNFLGSIDSYKHSFIIFLNSEVGLVDVNGMKITDVVVYPVKNMESKSKLVAFAKVVLNDQFIIHGVRIYEGVNGAFMTFPQDYNNKNQEGKPFSICHPTTAELRNYISDQVMAEFALTMSVEANHD